MIKPEYIEQIKGMWSGFTWIGKIILFPFIALIFTVVSIIDPLFDWLLTFSFFGRLSGKIDRGINKFFDLIIDGFLSIFFKAH